MGAKTFRSCLGFAALMLMLGGCGSGGSSSGIDGSKKIGDLTSTEQGTFCDWAANQLGGYKKCDEKWMTGTGHGFMSEPDRNACVDNWDDACAASVKQAEACINSLPECPSIEQAKASSACSDFIGC